MASAEQAIPAGNWKRLDGIDLLRGLAIFFVIMDHVHIRLAIAQVPYTKFLPAQLAHFLIGNGELGVQMFFVVSGFLIMSISLRRWFPLSDIRMRDFYLLRVARIGPLLLLLLAVLCGLHFAGIHNYVVTARTGGLRRAVLAALTFRINVLEARTWYLPPNWDILWSLSVEEMFYLFFPIVCFLFAGNRFGRGKLFVALLVAFVVLGPPGRTVWTHGNGIWKDYSYLGGMEGIALGCLTALLVWRLRLSNGALRILGFAGTALVVLTLIFSWQIQRSWVGRAGLDMTVLGIGTCICIAAAAHTDWKAPAIFTPLLKLGRYSYEVYLTHVFVVLTVLSLFLRAGKPMSLVPVYFISTILISGLLGAIVARFYSEPMNRYLRNRSSIKSKSIRAMDAENVLPSETASV